MISFKPEVNIYRDGSSQVQRLNILIFIFSNYCWSTPQKILTKGGGSDLKRFHKLTNNIVLEPLSYNPDNKTLIYTDETEIRPIGKMVWFCAAQGWQ